MRNVSATRMCITVTPALARLWDDRLPPYVRLEGNVKKLMKVCVARSILWHVFWHPQSP